MSGDGHTLAVGAPYYTFDDSSSNGRRECGRVVIFKWRNKRWEQFEGDLIGDLQHPVNGSYFEYDSFGFSLALNENGNVLVVGAPQLNTSNSALTGYVKVYGYKENLNKYEELSYLVHLVIHHTRNLVGV